MIKVKRVYEPVEGDDGVRVLVDRLWPRGIKKDSKIDLWLKDIAPSKELREWFSHDLTKFEDFKKRYKEELMMKKDLLDKLVEMEKVNGVVTLLYSARSKDLNNAIVLLEVLNEYKKSL